MSLRRLTPEQLGRVLLDEARAPQRLEHERALELAQGSSPAAAAPAASAPGSASRRPQAARDRAARSAARPRAAPRARSRCAARARCRARRARGAARAPRRSKPRAGRPSSRAKLAQEVVGEREQVLRALAQRRQVDPDHVEAEEEILAEAPAASARLEVAVGRRDDAHVGAQRLACRRRGGTPGPGARAGASPGSPGDMSPTSSRKSVPPLACSKRPVRWRSAPVNAPRSWPNSSDSSSVSGSAAQFTLTNGPPARGDAAWIRPGDQLLAGAGLAGEQHRRARRRDAARELDRGAQRRALADDRLRPRAARRAPRAARSPRRSSRRCSTARATRSSSCSSSNGFCDEVEGAGAHRLDGGLDAAVRGHQQHAGARVALARGARAPRGRRRPAGADRSPPRRRARDRGRRAAHGRLVAAGRLVDVAQRSRSARATPRAQRGVVLDHEDAARRARSRAASPRAGRRTRKVAPAPRRALELEGAAVAEHDLLRDARGRSPSRAPWW